LTRSIERGGAYYRAADPSWQDALDGSYAARHGGRWTPPGSYSTVYLCRSVPVARGVVIHNLAGLPYGPEDMDPAAAPVLVDVRVRPARYLDVVTRAGIRAAGLPATYPLTASGTEVGWEVCQPTGRRAREAGLAGVACLSARANGEELAHYGRRRDLAIVASRSFDDWFWPGP
jgi:hypothetical protein